MTLLENKIFLEEKCCKCVSLHDINNSRLDSIMGSMDIFIDPDEEGCTTCIFEPTQYIDLRHHVY